MAKGKGSIKGWITKNGVHIPIYSEYTVRGGVEPKVKGARFKRKRPDDLRAKDIHGQERLINRKDLEDALAEAKAKAAKADNENEWRQYATEARDIQAALDGKEVSPLVANNYGKLSAKKKPSMSEEDKTARTVADHYGVSIDKAKEGIASGKYSDDDIKTAKDYKTTMKNLEDKRDAGSISAEDYESSRKEAIKGFNESRKAKAEAEQVEGKGAVKDVEGSKTWQQEYEDEHSWTTSPNELIRNYEAKKKAKQEESKPRTSADNREERIAALKEKINAKTQERVEEYRKDDPNYKDGKYLKGQESSTANQTSTINDRLAQDAEKYRKNPWVAAQEGWGNGYFQEVQEYMNSQKNSKSQESSTSTSTPERKRYKSDGVMQAFKSAKEMTGRSDLEIHQLAQDGLEDHYSFRDKEGNEIGRFSNPHTSRAGYMTLNTSATGDRSKPISKQNSTKLGYDSDPNVFASRKEARDLNLGLRDYNKFKAEDFGSMSLTGLKQAYANASGSEKSKIAAELRRKGYSLIGGKWVKGK